MTLQQIRYAIAIADSGSMNEAAKKLYISQPSLSGAMKELEKELGFEIFFRSSRGILITTEGEEFLGYARQVHDQYELLSDHYLEKKSKKKFSVSMQHYSFAVEAFVQVVRQYGMDKFEFAVYETRTAEVVENVRNFKSELGILYLNDFNEKVLRKMFHENSLEFYELFTCDTFVYLWGKHPLAKKKTLSMEDLAEYPVLSFDQGKEGSLFLSEEQLSTYDYERIIKANDRATLLNLMVGLNAYTLCSGIISEDLNGDGYRAIPLKESEKMRIGYVKRKDAHITEIGQLYIDELSKYKKFAYNKRTTKKTK